MENASELIKQRRSVRTYDGRNVDEHTKEQLLAYAAAIRNPFDIPVEYALLDAKKDGLACPVVNGTDLYVGGKIENVPNACVAFGYSFEEFVLYTQSLGLGTVWLGGTMNRPAFEQAMDLAENQMMPCATPVGYAAEKMSVRENIMRKAVKADERLNFEELFFDASFDTPLTKEKAGRLANPLEMVRLAPSAVNKQPWRVVVAGDTAHFYLKRGKGLGRDRRLDMQMIDIGIALCHFSLTAREDGLGVNFVQNDPKIASAAGLEYIASYQVD